MTEVPPFSAHPSWRAAPPAVRPRRARRPVRALPDAEQHPAGHHEAHRPERSQQQARQDAAERHGLADEEPGAPAAPVHQHEGPDELPVGRVRATCGATASEIGELQHEDAGRSNLVDEPARRASSIRVDHVADAQLLPRVDDDVGAVDPEASQVLERVVAVEPAAVRPDLGEPGPKRLRRRIDRDGSGVAGVSVRDQLVAGQHRPLLCLGCTPAVVPGLPPPRVGGTRHRAEHGTADDKPDDPLHRQPPTEGELGDPSSRLRSPRPVTAAWTAAIPAPPRIPTPIAAVVD